MKGRILDFSIQTNTGIISGEDNKRYSFTGSEWKEQQLPARNMEVDFDIDELGHATGIYLALASETPVMATAVPGPGSPVPAVAIPSNSSSNIFDKWFSPPKDKTEEQYNPMDWYQKCIRNYVNFKGRARRKEFWFFQLVSFGFLLIGGLLFGPDSFFVNLFTLLLLTPFLTASARRLHDIGRSGWWTLIAFVPVAGILLLIFWWAQDTQPEANQYGLPAK